MDEEQRDALRERNQRRATTCRRCGSQSIHWRQGTKADTDLFEGVWYKVCGAYGYVWMYKNRPK